MARQTGREGEQSSKDPNQRPEVDYVEAEHDPVATRRASDASLRRMLGPSIQRKKGPGDESKADGRMPHADAIQASFGRHSIGNIRAEIGGDAGAEAQALGAEAFTDGESVAFKSEPSLRLAAHEAAHAVQQERGGVPMGGIDAGASDPLEHHADVIADTVVAGQSAEHLLDATPDASSSANGSRAIQRFVESEHKALGDEGSRGRKYGFGSLELSHGDLVMLSGDHFTPADLAHLSWVPSMSPGQLPETQDEILCVLFDEFGEKDPRFAPGGKWAGIKFSAEVKKKVKDRYYSLAQKNDMHFPNPNVVPTPGAPSAGGSYRELHTQALKTAYDAGQTGKSIDLAMMTEAMGQHFLTDSFASGHISTPRTSLKQYFNAKYPFFGDQFFAKVARDVASQLAADASGLSNFIPIGMLESNVASMVRSKLEGKPKPHFGDIVALATHGHDNKAGLQVTNDRGSHWTAHGDHQLEAPSSVLAGAGPLGTSSTMSNRDVAVAAVSAGCQEVERAYALGKAAANGAPLSSAELFARIKAESPVPGEKFAAEQHVPRIDNSTKDQGQLHWMVNTIQELWVEPIRTTGGETFGDFLFGQMGPSGDLGRELEEVKNGLDERMNPMGPDSALLDAVSGGLVASHGHLYPRKAFDKAVLQKLRNKNQCLAFLQAVVGE